MYKKSPAFGLAAVIIAYFALWLLVPRATFLPQIVDWLSHTAAHTPRIIDAMLKVIRFAIVALPTVAFMAIQIGIVYFFTRIKMDFTRALAAFVLSLGGAYGLMTIIVWQSGIAAKMHQSLTLRQQMYVVANYVTPLSLPYYVFIMFAAISLGYLVSLRIKDKNLLLPVVMFAAYIDFWTVTRGPVAQVIKNAPEVVQAVSTPIPHAGVGAFMPATMIGPGDFIFMGLMFAVVHRFAMRPARNYWFVFTAMTLGMLAVAFGLLGALPALTVLAVAVLAANRREFCLSREEKILTLAVGIMLLVTLPVVWSLCKHNPPTKPKAEVGYSVTTVI
ncbi:MAG: hypothetical protein ABFD49_11790 [Armatimonadota bacterium]|nr:hypothetical protein [bacterium]